MSKALRNVLTSIALVEAMVDSLEKNYRGRSRNKTIMDLTEKAKEATQSAMKVWPGTLDDKAVRKIALRVGRFEQAYGETTDFVFFSSTALGLIDDLYRMITDQKKRLALDRLITSIKRIHQYFDRDMDKTPIYNRAASAINLWRILEV